MRTTRATLLAQALEGTVVEDYGYRAILHCEEHGFMRYHTGNGLQKVIRSGKQWRIVSTILTSEEVDGFLKEMDLLPILDRPILDIFAIQLEGVIGEKFSSGGGVFEVAADKVTVRYSPISGLDIVTLSLTKWIRQEKILFVNDLALLVRAGEWEKIRDAYRHAVRAYRSRGIAGSRAVEEAEREARRLPEEAQRPDENRPGSSREDGRGAQQVQQG